MNLTQKLFNKINFSLFESIKIFAPNKFKILVNKAFPNIFFNDLNTDFKHFKLSFDNFRCFEFDKTDRRGNGTLQIKI